MAKILCKIPTRSRPEAFHKTFESFVKHQSNDHSVHYLISIDDDDQEMINYKNAHAKYLEDLGANVVVGPRSGKIGSVNRDVNMAPPGWEIIMQPADDFECLVQGWDNRVVEELDLFEDYDGVAWFFDGYQPKIDTLSIMGRKYYERFNYIYYPEYRTFWADVEFTEVADKLDRLVYCDEVLFRHDHPDWTHSRGYSGPNAGYDQLYIDNDKPEDRDWDEKLFKARQARGFDLELGESA